MQWFHSTFYYNGTSLYSIVRGLLQIILNNKWYSAENQTSKAGSGYGGV